jgi:exodeoxyribonuclease V alpha subunit
LDLAYAISIHKSQGSEYPAVIVLVHKAHRIMLRRNLIYTAMTRAKKFCCIIGSAWAIAFAAKQEEGGERFTSLTDLLQENR